jgi:hypothetical protein
MRLILLMLTMCLLVGCEKTIHEVRSTPPAHSATTGAATIRTASPAPSMVAC